MNHNNSSHPFATNDHPIGPTSTLPQQSDSYDFIEEMPSWNPLGTYSRRPSLLPHPNEINNELFNSYSFPPQQSNNSNNEWNINTVPMLPEVSEEPFYREQRSMSYSFAPSDESNDLLMQQQFLINSIMQEEDEAEEEFTRSRSKSSAAIMMNNNIWNTGNTWFPERRRASFVQAPLPQQQQLIRRFSLAPPTTTTANDYFMESRFNPIQQQPFGNYLNQRRHSLAGPTITTPKPPNILDVESLAIGSSERTILEEDEEEDYSAPTTINNSMGKGTRLDSDIFSLPNIYFYVVEFKGKRSDVFYNTDQLYKLSDLVIVEADRGKDLGKVAYQNISRKELVHYYQQLKQKEDEEVVLGPNEIYVKKIFRAAKQDEVTLFMTKAQDEAKALVVCQSKIKQKKLSMQVIDAEYQWDRRKLTFYFVAEKRVDFRELVRELFKLYKTRIWMCAVSSIKKLSLPNQ